jgi:hypothetical protein
VRIKGRFAFARQLRGAETPTLTGKSAIMLNARSISGYQGNLNIESWSIAGAGSGFFGVTSISLPAPTGGCGCVTLTIRITTPGVGAFVDLIAF